MKRVGYLYDKVMTLDNVIEAMMVYNRNRSVDRRHEITEKIAGRILTAMKDDFAGLVANPRKKTIWECGKQRELEIPSYRSCIAQLALWNVCGKYIDRRLHSQTFSSRKGMGGHLAAKKCARFVRTHRRDAKYCLYFDVRKYYAHIRHSIVIDRLRTIFKDEKIIDMFSSILSSAGKNGIGLPIGYPFSHSLANLYLVPLYFLMMSFKNVSRHFVYMDNNLVFSRYKKSLRVARVACCRWLDGVGCEMKHDWQIFPTDSRGVRICGFIIYPKGPMRIYRRIHRNILKNIDRLNKKWNKDDYLSLMSRKGWLMAINRHYAKTYKINGVHIWK